MEKEGKELSHSPQGRLDGRVKKVDEYEVVTYYAS